MRGKGENSSGIVTVSGGKPFVLTKSTIHILRSGETCSIPQQAIQQQAGRVFELLPRNNGTFINHSLLLVILAGHRAYKPAEIRFGQNSADNNCRYPLNRPIFRTYMS